MNCALCIEKKLLIESRCIPLNKKLLILIAIILLTTSIPAVAIAVPIEIDDPERDGYIVPGSRFRRGEVLSISTEEIEIQTNQGRERYKITLDTNFEKRGRAIGINQIKEGDKVTLSFHSIYTSDVANIKVEDEDRNITGILKGKLQLVDERNKEIIIKDPYIYKEGKWSLLSKYTIKLKTTGDNLYYGSQKINLQRLKNYINREVYIAYDQNLGRINVSKLLVKNGLSQYYEGKVSTILYTAGQMVVSKNSLNVHPGTIIVKNNRLVDFINIDKNNDVQVIADNLYGRKNSSIITTTTNILEDRTDNTRIAIYRGRIEDIYEYEVEIGRLNYRLDYQVLEAGKWKQVEDKQRFMLSEDTLIYDSELKENIDPLHFISSRYINIYNVKNPELRSRLENNYYKNKQAYFVVREGEYGKELLALNLVPHKPTYYWNVNLHYSTMGQVKFIDLDNKTIELEKVKNFNTLNNRWENSAEETIDLNKAVILLNDMPLPLERIYNIRPGSQVYVVKEKTSSIDEGYVLIIED